MPRPPAPSSPARLQTPLLATLWLLLLALFASQALVSLQPAAAIHWRRLDELAPWIALAVLALAGEQGVWSRSRRAARLAALFSLLLLIGALFTGLSLASSPSPAAKPALAFSLAANLLMAICALYLAAREFLAVSRALTPAGVKNLPRGAERGVTILHLWRFAAAQWGLLMIATFLYLAATMPPENRIGNPAVENLLFLLPVAGLLPNAMMAAGIGWWADLLAATGTRAQPRPRAWLAALIALNLAAILLVLRPAWLAIPGTLLAFFAIALYLLGFPALAWRTLGGKTLLASWLAILIALGALLLERLFALRGTPVSFSYNAAWHHLWLSGAVPLWCLAWPMTALACLLPAAAFRSFFPPAFITLVLLVAGTILSCSFLLASAMRFLILPAAFCIVALLLTAALLLRARTLLARGD